jgi:DNA-binding transcriptional ArsR family regulator
MSERNPSETPQAVDRRWVEVFSALASEPRLRIVSMLSHGRTQCQEILQNMDLSQPAISYHLGKLERAGILIKRRNGTRNCYEIDSHVRRLVRMITTSKEDRT